MQSEAFYDTIKPMFGGRLTQPQIDGIEAIINGCNQFGVTDKRMVAYVLATPTWETGKTMQPVSENGKGASHTYGKMIKQNGQPYTTPNFIYYGRGYTQNTWYENYQMLSMQPYAKTKGWDFLNHPELLLTVEPSAWATIHCMWHGSYTGVGLTHYFNDQETDYVNARKIINGLDQAQTIAGYAQTYFKALSLPS